LRTGWLTADRPIELPTVVTPPEITQDEVDRALAEVANRFVSAPVVVAVDGQLAELPLSVLGSVASFTPEGSTLELTLDGERLVEEVSSRTTDLLTEAGDARFVFVEGAPVIEPGTAGTTLDPEALAEAVAAAGTSDDR